MQSVNTKLREFMVRRGLSQTRLAKLARVSQSTVSRVLRGVRDRHGQARHRLLTYARIEETIQDSSAEHGVKRVTSAFSRIWDGSDEHATAIVNVIDALAGLKPAHDRERERKRGRHR
jgi:transcriptional regulator with XRE-family HTH domain